MKYSRWIGVDFDGTLHNDDQRWRDLEHFLREPGQPVPAMLERVQRWLADGVEVRIVTARVASVHGREAVAAQQQVIRSWCRKYLGRELEVTAEKGPGMIELWDDKAVRVEANTGRRLSLEERPPSYFASLGQPCCSRLRKTEAECMALGYVQALAASGNTWRRLTRQEVYDLLTPTQRSDAYVRHDDLFDALFARVADVLAAPADVSEAIGGFWSQP